MTFKLLLKLAAVIALAVIFLAVGGEQTVLADDCDFQQSGKGDDLLFFGPKYVAKGATIRVTLTAGPGLESLIILLTEFGDYRFSFSDTSPHTLTYKMPKSGEIGVILAWECSCDPLNTFVIHISGCSEAGPPAMNLFDGRINDHQGRDVAAPVAIYEGSIKVYGIDPASGDGWLDVDISAETIESVGIPTDAPVLLGQGKNHYTGIDIFVYRLPTGEFQLNTHYHDGKPYIFAWDTEKNKWHFAW
jgi:hypothetical protein